MIGHLLRLFFLSSLSLSLSLYQWLRLYFSSRITSNRIYACSSITSLYFIKVTTLLSSIAYLVEDNERLARMRVQYINTYLDVHRLSRRKSSNISRGRTSDSSERN